MIFHTIVDYCEELKRSHHKILIMILSYVPLSDLIRVVSRLCRKLYIVGGDLQLLKTYNVTSPIKPQSPTFKAIGDEQITVDNNYRNRAESEN